MVTYLNLPILAPDRKISVTLTTISGNTLDLTGYPYIPAFDGESFVAGGRAIAKVDFSPATKTYFAPSTSIKYGSKDRLGWTASPYVISLGYYIDGVVQSSFFRYGVEEDPFPHIFLNEYFGGGTIALTTSAPFNNVFYTVINSDAYNSGDKLYNVKTFGIASSIYTHLYEIGSQSGGLGGYVLGTSSDQAEAISTSLTFTPSYVEYVGEGIVVSEIDFTGEMDAPTNNSPYNPGGTSGPAGGGGTFGRDEVSDDVTGSIPTGTVEGDSSDAGVYTRYLMSLETLRKAGVTIWNKDVWVGITESALDLLLGSKANAMISLMSYPFDISQMSGVRFDTNRPLIIGGSRLEVTWLYDVLQSSAVQFDWGTVNIEQYYGSFLDYSPYTSIELYLPWGAGFVPIDPNECVPGSIRVVSNIEFDKGNCVHIVTAVNSLSGSETIIGSYSCNVAKEIPLLNTDYSAKGAAIITMAISAATSGAGAAAAANAAEDAASSAYTAALTPSPGYPAPKSLKPAAFEYATNAAAAAYDSVVQSAPKYPTVSATSLINAKPVIQRNGSFTSGSAGLGVQAPYLIISRPDQSVPLEYGHYYGYPSNIYSSLNSLRGYTEVGEIHLKGVNCTQKEYEEIIRLLKGGVVF